jgi:hypothetical protein
LPCSRWNCSTDVHVADAITISKAERFLFTHVIGHPQEAPAGHRLVAGIDQRDIPGFGAFVVHFHAVVTHIERNIGHMQEVIGKILLDYIALVTAADDEIMHSIVRIHFHDVP